MNARESLEQAYLSVARALQHDNTLEYRIAPLAPTANVTNSAADFHTKALQQLYNATAPPAANSVATESRGVPAADHNATAQQTSNSATSHPGMLRATIPAPTDMPDFLSGFDKVAGRDNSNCPDTQAGYDPAQFSPSRFTTGSFDDFHRLLGENLTPDVHNRLSMPGYHFTNSAVQNNNAASEARELRSFPFSGAQHPHQGGPRHSGPAVQGNAAHFRLEQAPPSIDGPPSAPRPPAASDSSRQIPQSQQEMLGQAFSEAMSTAMFAVGTSTQKPHIADSYSIFAQQSTFAASQHSAYISTHVHHDNEDSLLLLTAGDEFETMMGANTAPPPQQRLVDRNGGITNTNFTMPRRSATVVSDPSSASSDQGTDSNQSPSDGGSSSIDSDESNSESSRKKARSSANHSYSYGGQSAVHHHHHHRFNQHEYG